MNKVTCFIDRRSTHRYHLFVLIIINISNLAELGTGNYNDLFTQSHNTLRAAYSPKQYYISNQTSVLVTTGKAWLLTRLITT